MRPILDSSDIDIMKDDDMDKFLEYAKEWTGCDNAEIICKKDNDAWCLIVCAYTDDDGYCHCWLLRIWENPFSDSPNLSVDYHDTTQMKNADEHMATLGKAIAKWISW